MEKESGSYSYSQKLLEEYRHTLWRKMALESVAGIWPQTLADCKSRIGFTQELVEILRGNKRLGKKLYWIIFITYMTVDECECTKMTKYKTNHFVTLYHNCTKNKMTF